ncbi:MAG: hypothetical protein AAF478_11165 [Pseudomonadota bacterium]
MSFEKRKNELSFRPGSKPWKLANSPPKQGGWLWISLELAASESWKAAPPQTKLFILRLIEEHHQHAGMENGMLKLTYDQIEEYGVARRHIKWAIECAVALGLVKVTNRGSASGRWAKCATYALTFRPTIIRNESNLPTNEWKRFRSISDANAVLPEKKKRKHKIGKVGQCHSVTNANVKV